MNNMNEFRTSDIFLAVALICNSVKVEKLERFVNTATSKDYIEFVFEPTLECQKIEKDYWNNTLMVDALTFASEFKNLKARVFTRMKGGEHSG